MQFSESWLRTFCNPPISTKQLADLLTMSGLEVEELHPVAPAFSGVVVAEILTVDQHPNADRLHVCTVNAGRAASESPLQIVCGAPNVRVGMKAPLATVGAVLPDGEGKTFAIKVGKLRGVDSFGMLCAADELGISEDHDGLLALPDDAPVGEDIRKYLDLDDTVFLLKLTPNLAHHLSVYGIAREVSALTGSPLITPAIPEVGAKLKRAIPVRILDGDLCGRFTGRIVEGIDQGAKTPAWMVQRLERSGQRSVNALVDISNYVMFELGQPTHTFDCDKIRDHIEARWARPAEKIELLNGKKLDLDPKVGVVADASGAVSIAGIMGGESTSVTGGTKNVYIESAFWFPDAIAGRARRFNFSTDASHRYERGVDPELTTKALNRITALILEICGGQAGPVTDEVASMPAHKPVSLRVERAAKVIGMAVTQAECAEVMRRLGFPFTEKPGVITVNPPSYRFDIEIEEDLIEEVIRVRGYNTLPTVTPVGRISPVLRTEKLRSTHALRHALADLGYQETINYSFVEERWERELAGNGDPIKLLNPIAAHLSVMRSSLLGSLVGILRYNLARKTERVSIFEVGRVFRRDASVEESLSSLKGIAQPLHVAGLSYGRFDELQWGTPDRDVDFFDVKGDVETLLAPIQAVYRPSNHPALHPGRSAEIVVDGKVVGFVGELHPKVTQLYELPSSPVVFELDAAVALSRPLPAIEPVSRTQPIFRDLAIIVKNETGAEAVLNAVRACDPAIQAVALFDIYRPKAAQADISMDEKSLAIRLELLDGENPLGDEQVKAVMAKALKSVAPLGGRLRGV